MTRPNNILPKPDRESQLHCDSLLDYIFKEISQKGSITFARFMELALYTPGLGYYSAGNPKFGAEGDFITAPEISSLFSKCVAKQCQQILEVLPEEKGVLELGAGSGVLACNLLIALEKTDSLPTFYWILDLSADLKNRQKILFEEKIPHLMDRIKWLDRLPEEPFEGIILANEVLDAIPVHRFKQEDTLKEFFVQIHDGKLEWKLDPPSDASLIQKIEPLKLPYGYISEINLALDAWIHSISHGLKKGILLVIDYGYPEQEYYHPQRTRGTLTCYYRHRSHDNPLILTGIQDITAHVNFSALEKAAVTNGFQLAGYTNQASFLINCGLANMIDTQLSAVEQFKMGQEIKQLLLPSEMGELFKVMALSKGVDIQLVGFAR